MWVWVCQCTVYECVCVSEVEELRSPTAWGTELAFLLWCLGATEPPSRVEPLSMCFQPHPLSPPNTKLLSFSHSLTNVRERNKTFSYTSHSAVMQLWWKLSLGYCNCRFWKLLLSRFTDIYLWRRMWWWCFWKVCVFSEFENLWHRSNHWCLGYLRSFNNLVCLHELSLYLETGKRSNQSSVYNNSLVLRH